MKGWSVFKSKRGVWQRVQGYLSKNGEMPIGSKRIGKGIKGSTKQVLHQCAGQLHSTVLRSSFFLDVSLIVLHDFQVRLGQVLRP